MQVLPILQDPQTTTTQKISAINQLTQICTAQETPFHNNRQGFIKASNILFKLIYQHVKDKPTQDKSKDISLLSFKLLTILFSHPAFDFRMDKKEMVSFKHVFAVFTSLFLRLYQGEEKFDADILFLLIGVMRGIDQRVCKRCMIEKQRNRLRDTCFDILKHRVDARMRLCVFSLCAAMVRLYGWDWSVLGDGGYAFFVLLVTSCEVEINVMLNEEFYSIDSGDDEVDKQLFRRKIMSTCFVILNSSIGYLLEIESSDVVDIPADSIITVLTSLNRAKELALTFLDKIDENSQASDDYLLIMHTFIQNLDKELDINQ